MLMNVWTPFYDVSKVLDEMDRLLHGVNQPLSLRSVPRGTFPVVNIYDQGETTVLYAEMPGIDPEELELTVLNDTITLKGQRPTDSEGADHVYRQERMTGEFSRTLSLADPVNPETVKAEYKDGVLKVTLEKAETAKARKIPIVS